MQKISSMEKETMLEMSVDLSNSVEFDMKETVNNLKTLSNILEVYELSNKKCNDSLTREFLGQSKGPLSSILIEDYQKE